MSETGSAEIAVIGAGVVGLTTALHLAREGHEVVLIDPAEPGSGASYGNAGTIADYAMQPVGTPDVLRNLPSLLFDRMSPLTIRHSALPSLAPWLMRFMAQSLPGAARRNAGVIASLVADAGQRWTDLAAAVGGTDVLQHRGALYLYQSRDSYRAAGSDMALRRELGVTVDLVDPATVAELEPILPPVEGGGAYFPKAIFLNDPGRMVGMIAAAVRAAGVPHLRHKVERLQRNSFGVVMTGPGLRLTAKRVVLAAGAHSRGLARQAGDRVPLDTERGYHVEWNMAQPRLNRPTCPTRYGFYLCPMEGRLRVVGTVELGGLTAPPSPHRIARLVEGARSIFPDLGEPDREWMGFRPSIPDSIPVIGPSRSGSDIIHAYGHGHIGLTLAPITAQIVADLIAGLSPPVDPTATSPSRFSALP